MADREVFNAKSRGDLVVENAVGNRGRNAKGDDGEELHVAYRRILISRWAAESAAARAVPGVEKSMTMVASADRAIRPPSSGSSVLWRTSVTASFSDCFL